jgi:3-phenylpropionate/trans-cinnamate dioxygenase ferredoxin reductase component
MTDAPLLIVGASMAGLRTAEGARRAGYTGPIELLGDETHAPYNRPPLSKELLQTEGHGHDEVAFPIRSALEQGVVWSLGAAAASLDAERRVVTDAAGGEHPYSSLVIATGLRPKPLPIDSHGLTGLHVLRTLDDAVGLRSALRPGANVVILGSGFVGCEIAATAAKNGCSVSIVTQSAVPLERALGAELGGEVRRRHEAHGVRFFTRDGLFGLVGDPGVERVILTSGVMLECDVLVVAIGSDPNTEWLADSGLDVSDGVLVDGGLRAVGVDGLVRPDIFAVGDVARYPNPLFDDVARRVEHWNLPTETGKRAGQLIAAHLAGEDCEPLAAAGFAPLPSFWSDQYDMHLLAFGMTYLADRSVLVAGALDDECVLEYYRGDALVGVCGIGMRSLVQGYRSRFTVPTAAV